jgi:ribosome-associated protein
MAGTSPTDPKSRPGYGTDRSRGARAEPSDSIKKDALGGGRRVQARTGTELSDRRLRGLDITPGIEVPRREVVVEYSRAAGPGGQHVNKTETRVTLRFDLVRSPSIPEADRARMAERLRARLTKSGEILVSSGARRDRTQNLTDAFERLAALLRQAYTKPKKRKKTRPSKGAKERRLQDKRSVAGRKQSRRTPEAGD